MIPTLIILGLILLFAIISAFVISIYWRYRYTGDRMPIFIMLIAALFVTYSIVTISLMGSIKNSEVPISEDIIF